MTVKISKEAHGKSNGHSSVDATRKASLAAHQAIDSLIEPAARAERKVRDIAAKAEQVARESKKQARSRTQQLLDDAQVFAHKRPLAAAGVSFAAGLLLSRLLRR